MLYDKKLLFDSTVFEIGAEMRVKSLKMVFFKIYMRSHLYFYYYYYL